MAGTNQLQLYNGAIRILGSEGLATLTDNVESRLALDDVWADGAVQYCLETGQWTFATRTVESSYDPDITTQFGYSYAFSKPIDYVKLVAMSLNGFFTTPLINYSDETGFWYADATTLFIKYISTDPAYGLNMGNWPQSFGNLVEAYLAMNANMRITKSLEIQKKAEETYKSALRDARSKDNMNQPVQFMPVGSWTRARIGGRLSSQGLGIFNAFGNRDY